MKNNFWFFTHFFCNSLLAVPVLIYFSLPVSHLQMSRTFFVISAASLLMSFCSNQQVKEDLGWSLRVEFRQLCSNISTKLEWHLQHDRAAQQLSGWHFCLTARRLKSAGLSVWSQLVLPISGSPLGAVVSSHSQKTCWLVEVETLNCLQMPLTRIKHSMSY